MAKLTIGSEQAVDMSKIDIDFDGTTSASPSHIHIDYGDGEANDFYGSFQYSGGKLAGGTITEIKDLQGTDTVFDLTDVSLSVQTFAGYVNAHDPQGLLGWIFSGDDTITGGAGKDVLYGFDGNDVLDGGKGKDKLVGGKGDDTYVVDEKKDAITEAKDEGHDLVQASVSYTLAANVEDLQLTGKQDLSGTGNAEANAITGNSGDNKLHGAAGADTLDGGSGNDKLYGEADADTLKGGKGNDLLDGGAGKDHMAGGKGDDAYHVDNKHDVIVEAKGEGYDKVLATASYTLSANVEQLELSGTGKLNGTGNDGDNKLLGGDGKNVLKGLDGNDYIDGGKGDDTIVGGHGTDKMHGGAGADTFVFADGDVGASTTKADRITDFDEAKGDRIDLSHLDSIAGGGHDAFSFIGTGAFDGTAGELRIKETSGNTYLVADTDGDKLGDLYIRLDGHVSIDAHAFTDGSLIITLP